MLLKKAGMVVLAAGAGVVALTPTAFAGTMPEASSSDNGSHSWDGGKDHDHGHHGHWGHGGSGNHHSGSSSCDNDVNQLNASRNGGLLSVLDGANAAVPVNACHILDDNNILNNIGVDVL
jgi:hypothetical protein